jgi:hypothetical protein
LPSLRQGEDAGRITGTVGVCVVNALMIWRFGSEPTPAQLEIASGTRDDVPRAFMPGIIVKMY